MSYKTLRPDGGICFLCGPLPGVVEIDVMGDGLLREAAENHPSAVSTVECDWCCFSCDDLRMLPMDGGEQSKGV